MTIARGATPTEPPLATYSDRGRLLVDGVDLAGLADRYGTPLFVGSRARLATNVARLEAAFSPYPGPFTACYSCKTNGNLAVLRTLADAGVVAAVCSGLDYYAARRAGFPPDRIVLGGLLKTEQELACAIGEGVRLIVAESFDEIRQIDRLGQLYGKRVPIALRVRLPQSRWHISVKDLLGFSYDRFGFDLASGQAIEGFREAARLPGVDVCGLHTHGGSHYKEATPFVVAISHLVPFIRKVQDQLGLQIRYLNLGGGLGSDGVSPARPADLVARALGGTFGRAGGSRCPRRPYDIGEIGARVTSVLAERLARERLEPCTLMFEPGRFFVGDAFVLVVRVCLRKRVPRKGTWLIVDGGTNLVSNLLLLNERHEIAPVVKRSEARLERVSIAGPLLYSSDVLAFGIDLPRTDIGDTLALLDAGAYTLAYSNQFLQPRPAVVLIDGDGTRMIRQAESYADVLSKDCP